MRLLLIARLHRFAFQELTWGVRHKLAIKNVSPLWLDKPSTLSWYVGPINPRKGNPREVSASFGTKASGSIFFFFAKLKLHPLACFKTHEPSSLFVINALPAALLRTSSQGDVVSLCHYRRCILQFNRLQLELVFSFLDTDCCWRCAGSGNPLHNWDLKSQTLQICPLSATEQLVQKVT